MVAEQKQNRDISRLHKRNVHKKREEKQNIKWKKTCRESDGNEEYE